MPLASNLITFVFPFGFLGGHIGLKHLHGVRRICQSIFIMIHALNSMPSCTLVDVKKP
jgi:hypothetical protein